MARLVDRLYCQETKQAIRLVWASLPCNHDHRPDLINFNKFNKDDHLGNLRNAFGISEKHLGIPKLKNLAEK